MFRIFTAPIADDKLIGMQHEHTSSKRTSAKWSKVGVALVLLYVLGCGAVYIRYLACTEDPATFFGRSLCEFWLYYSLPPVMFFVPHVLPIFWEPPTLDDLPLFYVTLVYIALVMVNALLLYRLVRSFKV